MKTTDLGDFVILRYLQHVSRALLAAFTFGLGIFLSAQVFAAPSSNPNPLSTETFHKSGGFRIMEIVREGLSPCLKSQLHALSLVQRVLSGQALAGKGAVRFLEAIQERAEKKGLLLVFDRLKLQNIRSSGFFVRRSHPEEFEKILIDCDVVETKHFAPVLIHELVHFYLSESQVPSWLEEGLAQSLEASLSTVSWNSRVEFLSRQAVVPPLIDEARPLRSPLTYITSKLFVDYLETLQPGSLERIMAKKWESKFYTAKECGPETLKDYVRSFAMALVLVQVPGWKGFVTKPLELSELPKNILPSQFLRLSKGAAQQLKSRLDLKLQDLEFHPLDKYGASEVLLLNSGERAVNF